MYVVKTWGTTSFFFIWTQYAQGTRRRHSHIIWKILNFGSTFLLIKKNNWLKKKQSWQRMRKRFDMIWLCKWSRELIVRAVSGGRSFFTVDWDKALLSDWHESSSSVTASWRVASSYLFNQTSLPLYNTVLLKQLNQE